MKQKFIAICSKCNEIILKKRTPIKLIIKEIFIVFILITSIIGTLGIYNFLVGGIYENPDLMFSIGGINSFILNFKSHFQSNNQLKEIAQNLTSSCEDDYCKVKAIYEHLLTFDYRDENATRTNSHSLMIWESKEGDCDELSYLLNSLLSELKINSVMQCTQSHCYSIVKLKDKKILIDVVQQGWEEKCLKQL